MIALLAAAPVQAAMYKWVDAQGNTHYGDTLPPQAAGRANVELNKKGMPVKKNEAALTPEQLRERDAEQARLNKAQQAQEEQRRRDRALLNTYTTTAEIDLARDRNLEQAQLTVRGTEARLEPLRASQARLDQQAAVATRNQRPVPAPLAEERAAIAREIAQLEEIVAQKRREMDAMRAKFDADKARFIELTQGR